MPDRPLTRRLIRLAAPLLGPRRAHRADLWPGLAIDRASGAARWRGRPLLTLARLLDLIPEGVERLAVVGSGPSLAAQAPERLAPGTAILLNGAASLAPLVAPLAVMVEDERFVARHWRMLAALPDGVPLMLSAAALRALCERSPGTLARRPVALLDDLRKPVGGARKDLADPALDPVLERDGAAALSRDPDRGVVIVGTVAFSALQVALAARPREVLLAGIDLANAGVAPRFYEVEGRAAPSGIVRGLPRILAGFSLARTVAAREGVALACASPVSALLPLGYGRDASLDRAAP